MIDGFHLLVKPGKEISGIYSSRFLEDQNFHLGKRYSFLLKGNNNNDDGKKDDDKKKNKKSMNDDKNQEMPSNEVATLKELVVELQNQNKDLRSKLKHYKEVYKGEVLFRKNILKAENKLIVNENQIVNNQNEITKYNEICPTETLLSTSAFNRLQKPNSKASPLEISALFQYQQIGRSLSNDPFYQNLRKELIAARDLSIVDSPFYVVLAPSGSGKSQLPFALENDDLKVLHLVMSDMGASVQPVYLKAMEKSECLNQCLDEDVDLNCRISTSTIGFILRELGVTITPNMPCSIETLRHFVENCEDKKDIPIIVLDEAMSSNWSDVVRMEKLKKLDSLRKILSAAGLTFILMGTSPSVITDWKKNDINPLLPTEKEKLLFKLISKLPSASEASLKTFGVDDILEKIKIHSALCNVFKKQFKTCLPRFIETFGEVVQSFSTDYIAESTSVDLLDRIAHEMASILYQQKTMLRSEEGLKGQLALHSHRGYSGDSLDFLRCHFAILFKQPTDIYINQSGDLVFWDGHDFVKWHLSVCFPRDDLFLNLLLGGGKNDFPPPFLSFEGNKSTRMSTKQAFLHARSTYNETTGLRHLKNQETTGLRLNLKNQDTSAMIAVAVEIASHQNGCAGIQLNDFLLYLMSELLPQYKEVKWTDDEVSKASLDPTFFNTRIPYLSANNEWPSGIYRTNGSFFRNFYSNCNLGSFWCIAGLDINGMTVHSSKKMSLDELKKEFSYFPIFHDEKLRIIFCHSLPDEDELTSKSMDYWEDKNPYFSDFLKKFSILKLDKVSENEVNLSPVFRGMSESEVIHNQAIIFIPMKDL